MATIKFKFSSTVSGVFDNVDFFAGQTEIFRSNGKYAFNGEIPENGVLNIAIDVSGNNAQQIDVAYSCETSAGVKLSDPNNPSVVTKKIEDNRFRRIQLRIPF
ncbi:hypothetical protein [Spirosoma linguale]|uniref:Uncharacterized protein n=1 Tax=Spirosoma linguale (strain ATCC 33905 / DSM 74 / LMG 10896 / Claus 1) TaxID=504472 RepID=D2QTT3_SPILD|nr:hypothetical protein Slin_6256 [Spirosoma linguale DSM 74]